MSKTTNKFSPEVRARAVRLVLDNEGQRGSRWQSVMSIAAMRRVVISAKKRSTMFIYEALVGVKCSLKRGCFSSQVLTSGVLWVA